METGLGEILKSKVGKVRMNGILKNGTYLYLFRKLWWEISSQDPIFGAKFEICILKQGEIFRSKVS